MSCRLFGNNERCSLCICCCLPVFSRFLPVVSCLHVCVQGLLTLFFRCLLFPGEKCLFMIHVHVHIYYNIKNEQTLPLDDTVVSQQFDQYTVFSACYYLHMYVIIIIIQLATAQKCCRKKIHSKNGLYIHLCILYIYHNQFINVDNAWLLQHVYSKPLVV